jgi:hypothetical protein
MLANDVRLEFLKKENHWFAITIFFFFKCTYFKNLGRALEQKTQ